MKSDLQCKIDGTIHKSYKSFSAYLKRQYNMSSNEYHTHYIGKGICKECGGDTHFKNLQIGYREFCSVLCLNRHKSKDKAVLNKISSSQRGIPRKLHSNETKEKCRQIMLNEWVKNRDSRSDIMKRPEVRKKISEKISEIGFRKNISYINNIRCESSVEREYIEYCIKNNIQTQRFSHGGRKSIDVGNNWRVPDFLENNRIVEIKDFHPWFKNEIRDGLMKYKEIREWCEQNKMTFIFWIKSIGYKTIEEALQYGKS